MQIYLDNAATTKMSSTSLHAMLPYFNEQYGNPSSLCSFGQKANEAITDAREKIAAQSWQRRQSKRRYRTTMTAIASHTM